MKQPIVTATLGSFWGARVAARRADLGLTQTQFAEVVGTTQQTISKIEKGEMIPHDKLKVTIAQRTGTKVDELFAWPEGPIDFGASA